MLQLVLTSNAIHLEAARRLRRWQRTARPEWELLLYEPNRVVLESDDRGLWPWRLPIHPLSLTVLALAARLGLVGRLRLSHLRGAGRALRELASHVRQLELLDDGLDQYRAQPRAVDPGTFAAGLPCWLFSDRPAHRAPWCARFECRELGPLFVSRDSQGQGSSAPVPASGASPKHTLPEFRTLIVDSPGVERLHSHTAHWPHPWRLVPHPVAAKRHWNAPLEPGDQTKPGHPETVLHGFGGRVVVGESLVLLAALTLCGPGAQVIVALPRDADANLWRLIRDEVVRDTRLWVLP